MNLKLEMDWYKKEISNVSFEAFNFKERYLSLIPTLLRICIFSHSLISITLVQWFGAMSLFYYIFQRYL